MIVKELIEKLQKQNPNAEVKYDGDGRWTINTVERSMSDDNVVLLSF